LTIGSNLLPQKLQIFELIGVLFVVALTLAFVIVQIIILLAGIYTIGKLIYKDGTDINSWGG